MTTHPGADLPPLPRIDIDDPLWLHRFSVKPHHLDAWRAAFPAEVELRRRHGFTWYRAFVDTPESRAEPKVTWLYSHPDARAGEASLASDPDHIRLQESLAPHVFRNLLVRPVRPEIVTRATPESIAPDGKQRLAIMRRYSIVGGWDAFLDIWRRIVTVREHYGFRCLFAVADEPADLFTWAFDFGGTWDGFPDAQRAYYHDPDRVALRGVFDHMADYQITPSEQLLLPDACPAP